ncbi:MAG TPA: MFS transporter, partial [Terriglobales bacterium]|nr:MFS transporter [Terriglobales bacterium]
AASLPADNSLSAADQRHAIAASFMGWTLDAFDFFVLTFLIGPLSQQFHVPKSAIVLTLTMTLAMRPVGALLFGMLADRYGRRRPLMANVIFFSVVELLCGFAPNYAVFFGLRTIFGIGMGGEWGVGASLAMESVSSRRRGIISGVIQSGYSTGYLLAAIAARLVLPLWGWRAMFWVGGLPALLAFYIRYQVKESRAWEQHRAPTVSSIVRTAATHWKLFLYLVVMMALMNCLSHGTQDLYPDFLSSHGIAPATVSYLAMLYNVGAILGGIGFGHFSEKIGRRWGMLLALALALLVIPLWAFSARLAALAIGAFLMQVGVQGAWGIIPAHLNELSPDTVRGMLPGFAYQIGILFASPTNTIEYALRDHLGYSWALASFEIAVMLLLAITVALGSEKRGKSFLRPTADRAPA